MTRRDYIELAKLLSLYYHSFASDDAFREFLHELSKLLLRGNPRFDKDRFFIAVYSEIENSNA